MIVMLIVDCILAALSCLYVGRCSEKPARSICVDMHRFAGRKHVIVFHLACDFDHGNGSTRARLEIFGTGRF
jgi:hypothetical protein